MGTLILQSFGINGNIYVHQQRIDFVCRVSKIGNAHSKIGAICPINGLIMVAIDTSLRVCHLLDVCIFIYMMWQINMDIDIDIDIGDDDDDDGMIG